MASGSIVSQPKKKVKLTKREVSKTLLVETAWEVCNQVGGIYTVIRSKVPTVKEIWKDNYLLLGPAVHPNVDGEFDPITDYNDPIGKVVKLLQERGWDVRYGHWLVSGRPKVVLFNPYSVFGQLGDIKYNLYDHHHVPSQDGDQLLDQVLAFGEMVKVFTKELAKSSKWSIIMHFHEWMSVTALPEIRRENIPVTTVFTTHATLLGRYLAMNDPYFYDHLPFVDWEKEAIHFNIETQVKIERAAAHGSHVFSTVSDVTGLECEHLLGRKPDVILPNGLNIERFVALHEFQNLHLQYKQMIHQFVMAHFFQSYTFDLDKTLYFFTSGRYEYRNKGFDLTLEALARLNYKMRKAGMDTVVVMFFITKKPYHSINPQVLQSRAVMNEIRQNCDAITKQIGDRLFYEAAKREDNKLPSLNEFVDDYLRLRLRRTLQSWKSDSLPPVVTHNLMNDGEDDILNFLRSSQLVNHEHDNVKIVYHPDFVSPTNPLFGMEYGQFVRGCHMGVFPSYYEPWGYTPLECMASGVPAVTSDLSGFGDYAMKNMHHQEENGLYVIKRDKRVFDDAANQLTHHLFKFVQMSRRQRIDQRNRVEHSSVAFDWKKLATHYEKAYKMSLERKK